MVKIFGRNKGRPFSHEYEEPDRVLEAVTFVPDVGAVECIEDRVLCDPWYDYDSVYQQTAFEGQYPDIFEELCKINDKVVFSE